jgi:hypothetical protein
MYITNYYHNKHYILTIQGPVCYPTTRVCHFTLLTLLCMLAVGSVGSINMMNNLTEVVTSSCQIK